MTAFVERLCAASPPERVALLRAGDALFGVRLAYSLKEMCDSAWANNPARAVEASAVLRALTEINGDPEIAALNAWAAGIAAITEGTMEAAIEHLDDAAGRFTVIGKTHVAAATQVSKLIALAMLGRYDEAFTCGMQARDTFLAYEDELSAGKIEQNLGTMAWRRDKYREAEQFHRTARTRFLAVGHSELVIAAENGLANALASQLRVREATEHYKNALAGSRAAGLELRQAEIECNLGNLALAQGRYDSALDYLERSRRRYVALDMPHESAYAEQELAEAYLHMNLAKEAAAIYARVTPTFGALGMRAEQAWALAHHGQAAVMLERPDEAKALFDAARQLFAEEGNTVSAALVSLFETFLAYQRGDYAEVVATTQEIEELFAAAGSHIRALLARWLRGEALRASGRTDDARAVLEATLRDAEQHRLPHIIQRCYAALGLLAIASGDAAGAEKALKRAVAMLEELRAPLPSEELRTAFVADKLTPYAELVRLCLESAPVRVGEALHYAEQARARALAEMLGQAVHTLVPPRDTFEAQMVERVSELRAELNWISTQITQNLMDGKIEPVNDLYTAMHEREEMILEVSRQLQLHGGSLPGTVETLDIATLQHDLGEDTALVTYYSLHGELLAFVVTNSDVRVARALGNEAEIEALVERLRFQIESLRRGARVSTAHHDQLLRRVQHYLAQLHRLLLAPLEPWLDQRRLVVVPHRALHYIPFHALYDGEQYTIEQREVCTVPSASVLHHCLMQPRRAGQRAVLVGVPDARAPRVRDEVLALAALFPEHVTLLDGAARASELRRHAPAADVLHLACHGSFRPDSPLFSALHLSDGLFTTRDAYTLDLHCQLVVLSACETGVNTIAPGDELIGLARGFFAAGTPALLVSQWMVDDDSTAELMSHLYTRLRAGDTPAQALRAAQCALMRLYPHPFFWAPFGLMGRW